MSDYNDDKTIRFPAPQDELIPVLIPNDGAPGHIDRESMEAQVRVAELYDLYKVNVCSYISYLIGDRQKADQLTEQTFTAARSKVADKDTAGDNLVWLMQLATAEASQAAKEAQDTQYGKNNSWLEEGDATATFSALGAISLQQRGALLLRTHEGFTDDGIAQALGVPSAEVGKLMRNARIAFRESMPKADFGSNST